MNAIVYVVDGDATVRDSLSALIRSAGFGVKTFASAEDFLRHRRPSGAACLVVDVRLNGLSGLDLQTELADAADPIPMIFVTGCHDIPTTVRAMKAGAADFLLRPVRDENLLGAIRQSLQHDEAQRREQATLAEIQSRYAALTSRQRQVMALVASGTMNKQIAARLDITEITVKVHRHNMMQTMKAASLPALVRMFQQLGLPDPPDPRRPVANSKGVVSSNRSLFGSTPAQPRPRDARPHRSVVSILSDEATLRDALQSLLRSAGYATRCHASADDFLQAARLAEVGCLVVVEVGPRTRGIALQRQLLETNAHVPTVFISVPRNPRGEPPSRWLRSGVVCLPYMPFSDGELLLAVRTAFGRYRTDAGLEAT